MNIIIEGIDHCGKDTLINNLQNSVRPGAVFHSSKPPVLDVYKSNTENENDCKFKFQSQYFERMFEMMDGISNTNFVNYFNRLHLGEYVYGNLYRGFTDELLLRMIKSCEGRLFISRDNTYLFLLLMHHPENRKFDIDAFDFSKGDIEQERFITAFNHSTLNKKIIFVDDKNGNWRDSISILTEVKKYISEN